ncbi:phage tail protein [Pseudomonas sp. UBA6323]|uniref:phage tail protein n=1 Tax=Pseudomonas sp. UBA6323 TaxID=1947329 RepID=UPI0025E122AE|nr:tail fiber protein [Pseudomonas sp. UBA6323]
MEVFIGTIQPFAFPYAPAGWAFCNGQLLAISQFNALFALVGTTYGGNGSSTFGLPNLQGRMPIGQGAGGGLTNRPIGQMGGIENITLTPNNMPMHTHSITSALTVATNVQLAATASNPVSAPTATNSFIGASGSGPGSATIYSDALGSTPVTLQGVSSSLGGTVTAAAAGGSQPFGLMNPFLAVNFSIALNGIFPSRN